MTAIPDPPSRTLSRWREREISSGCPDARRGNSASDNRRRGVLARPRCANQPRMTSRRSRPAGPAFPCPAPGFRHRASRPDGRPHPRQLCPAAADGATDLLQAAAKAGLVGGVADWFAITALFRHPLGHPDPAHRHHPRAKGTAGPRPRPLRRHPRVHRGGAAPHPGPHRHGRHPAPLLRRPAGLPPGRARRSPACCPACWPRWRTAVPGGSSPGWCPVSLAVAAPARSWPAPCTACWTAAGTRTC